MYLPGVSLSTKQNHTLLQKLNSEINGMVHWSKHLSGVNTKDKNGI